MIVMSHQLAFTCALSAFPTIDSLWGSPRTFAVGVPPCGFQASEWEGSLLFLKKGRNLVRGSALLPWHYGTTDPTVSNDGSGWKLGKGGVLPFLEIAR